MLRPVQEVCQHVAQHVVVAVRQVVLAALHVHHLRGRKAGRRRVSHRRACLPPSARRRHLDKGGCVFGAYNLHHSARVGPAPSGACSGLLGQCNLGAGWRLHAAHQPVLDATLHHGLKGMPVNGRVVGQRGCHGGGDGVVHLWRSRAG